MTRTQIKKATNNELLVDYILSYARRDQNFVLRRGTERLENHIKDLEAELLHRNILTQQDIDHLNL